MGDLYKCKKCGQLCYGPAVAEIDGSQASEILNTIAVDGFIESADAIPFLDSDFSQFLQKRVGVAAVRYDAYPTFPNVISNMRHDKVVIGTKRIEDGYVTLSCPICQSQEFFSTIGSLPTTFVDGRWDNYVDSDHTWYLLSDGNNGNGSFTYLETRELTNYVLKEDRVVAQEFYDEIIQECSDTVVKSKSSFVQTKDVDLTQYFRTLMNVKTDIQIMETRLFDLILNQLPAERSFINSTCRSEETIVNEIDKEKHQIAQQVAKLRGELEFKFREDWREAYGVVIPQEPVKPVMEAPVEPEYKQAGLFNRKEIAAENDALRTAYSARVQEYNRTINEYTAAMEQFKTDKENYEAKQKEIYLREQNAWENDADNIAKRQTLQDLTNRDAELDSMLENPLKYAQKMLENTGPEKVKRLFENEVERNADLLKKAYQTEADLQNILFVFPKYLDIVAVSKIYEYLVTGRVTSLTGANGAYTLYESEMRNNRSMGLAGISRKTENTVVREYTIYNALSSVSKIMNEIGEKTEAAVNELEASNDTDAVDDYAKSADAFYSLINEDLKICAEFSDRYLKEPEPVEPEVPEEAEENSESPETSGETISLDDEQSEAENAEDGSEAEVPAGEVKPEEADPGTAAAVPVSEEETFDQLEAAEEVSESNAESREPEEKLSEEPVAEETGSELMEEKPEEVKKV